MRRPSPRELARWIAPAAGLIAADVALLRVGFPTLILAPASFLAGPIFLLQRRLVPLGAVLIANSLLLATVVVGVGGDRCVRCASERGTREYHVFGVEVFARHGPASNDVPSWTRLPDPGTCEHDWRSANRCAFSLGSVTCGGRSYPPPWEGDRVQALQILAARDPSACRRLLQQDLRNAYGSKNPADDPPPLPRPIPRLEDPDAAWEAWLRDCETAANRGDER